MLFGRCILALPFVAVAASHACPSQNTSLSVKLLASLEEIKASKELDCTDALQYTVKQAAEQLDSIACSPDNQDAYGKAGRTCRVMSLLFGNRTVTNSSQEYVSELGRSWSTTTWLPAACFVKLRAPSEVAAALGVITFVQSKFSVRSRGHNDNPGFSSVNQTGVLLDLRAINAVTVNGEASVASAGPGASWGDVYGFLNSYNRSVVGGRHGDVGVAGLMLGGGIPYFASLTGLASSNVRNFQVVLANSTLVDANVEQNPDLFYALKGGGPNYGIVTRVDMNTIPLHNVWYSLAIYNATDAAIVLDATARWHEYSLTDPKLGYFLNVNTNGLFAGLLYADWTSWPEAYEPFRNLVPAITLANATNGTISSLVATISSEDPDARRWGASVTHRFDPSLYNFTYARYLARSQLNGSATGGLAYTIQPIGPNIGALQQRSGGSPFTVEPVDQDWIVAPVSWGSAADDAAAIGAAAGLVSDITAQAEQSGDLLDLVFQNDAAETQSPLRSYGEDVLQRLQGIARSYDPSGVFQNLQFGGFLLARA